MKAETLGEPATPSAQRKPRRGERTSEGTRRAAAAAAAANALDDPELEQIQFPLRLQRRLIKRIDDARGTQTRAAYVRTILENHHDPERNAATTER